MNDNVSSGVSAGAIRPGDRVLVRDDTWKVKAVREIVDGRAIVELEPDQRDRKALTVIVPPEKIYRLPTERPSFDLRCLGPITPWRNAHKLIAVTSIKDEVLLSGARFGRVKLEAYQIAPVLRILSKPSPRLLIADDVGLGKTVEAGLCMLELMARRRANRVLVVVPAGLISQWKEEFLEKFGIDLVMIENASGFARAQTQLPAGVNPWDVLPRVLTSIDYLKKKEVCNRVLRQPWDLIIVDEAHYLAESGTPKNPYRTNRTRLGTCLQDKSRALLLLTATPHNGYPHTFRSLIELVEPTSATFGGDEEKTLQRLERARIRRMKSQIKRKDEEGNWVDAFFRRNVEGIAVTNLADDEKELFQLVSSYCSKTARKAEGEEDESLIVFAMQIVKKRMVSSRRALKKTIQNRLQALKREEAREEKPEKSELRDFQAQTPMSDKAAERISQRIIRSAIPAEEKRRKEEVKRLNQVKKLLDKLPQADPKVEALISHLREVFDEDPEDKVIVFTEYLDTLDAVRERLDSLPDFKGRYVVLKGGMTLKQRLRMERQFEEPSIRLLLATDAASEGLNLQRYCHRVVHFELPWNPNRLEQRNGRVDRYGQTQRPEIRYLFYPDSPEDDVMARLVDKIEAMHGDRISTPDLLGVLWGAEEVIEGLTALDPENPDLESAKDSLVKTFEDKAVDFLESGRILLATDENISRALEDAEELLHAAEPLLKDDGELEELLQSTLGACMKPDGREGVYRISVPPLYRGPGVAPLYKKATIRRSIATATKPEEVEFITPLHPLVQALGSEAHRSFIAVYPDQQGNPPKRLAARRVPAGSVPGVIFTFLGEVTGAHGTIEETIVPVRVDLAGVAADDPESDRELLFGGGEVGEVPAAKLEELFKDDFDRLYEAALAEAMNRVKKRAEAIRERRMAISKALAADLASFKEDRLRELEQEYRDIRGLIGENGQLQLEVDATKGEREYRAKLAALDSYIERRREEIEAYQEVEPGGSPRPIGALFLVPEDS